MRKEYLILMVLTLIFRMEIFSQSPNISESEYYIDVDPGFGNGTPLAFTPDSIIDIDFTLDVSGLTVGHHRVYVRTQDDSGNWSLTYKQDIFKSDQTSNSPEPLSDIVAMEYYFDTDPGYGNGISIPVTSDSIIDMDVNLDVGGLSIGHHRVFVRAKNETGKWSLTYKEDIYKTENPVIQEPAPDIVESEYYIDIDPGFGNGIPVSFTPDSIVDISFSADVASLLPGNHRIYVRSKDENGEWSLTYKKDIYKTEPPIVLPQQPLPAIVEAEYFFNTDPGYGSATPVTINPDSIVNISYSAGIDSLDIGTHWLHVRVKDEEDRWSLNYFDTINILIRAGISATDTLILVDTPIQFNDFSSSNVISWQWDFENDGTIDDTDQNPIWTYNSVGIYDVKLIVSDGVNNDTIIKYDYIYVDTHLGFTKVTDGDIVNDGGNSHGITWTDYNNDNYLDVFVTNKSNQNNFLYLNNTDGSFSKISSGNIVSNGGDSEGSTWGDYNNDGFLDLFVANLDQTNFLYLNNGDDTFTRTLSGDINIDSHQSMGCSWGDYDNDGMLDLFVANHNDADNYFYKNWGDDNFEKINIGIIANDGGTSNGFSWADYNNDGNLDLFVANSGQNNFLYKNLGNGTFEKILTGDIVNDGGNSHGVSWGDYNNDGLLDLFVANRSEVDFLYTNSGNGIFTKVTSGDIVTNITNSVGSSWVDYDNDGDLDMYVVNSDDEDNTLYRNDGSGIFTEIEPGQIMNHGGNSWGTSWSDFDNDGDLDLMVANEGENNFLYNNQGNSYSWLNIECVGMVSNRSAIGTKIKAKANIFSQDTWQSREIFGQTGFCGQNSLNVEFGFGDATVIDSLQVRWPSGIVFDTTNVAINQFLTIVENSSQYVGPGPIVINEIMVNPSAVSDPNGEWIELYNIADTAVDLDGWTIKDLGFDTHTINSSVILSPGQYIVLGRNSNSSSNGGVNVDYVYETFSLSNNVADEILLISPASDTVDIVEWDGGPYFPNPNGSSMELINPILNNNIGINWFTSTQPYGLGDKGTPGMVNPPYAPQINVYPDTLHFPLVAIWETDTAFATIRNSGITDLIIDTITFNLPDFDVNQYQFIISPNDSVEIAILFTPQQAGFIKDTVFIHSNDPTKLADTLLLSGSGSELIPDIITNPDSLVFDELFVTLSDNQFLDIANIGVVDLIIDSIYTETIHFYPETIQLTVQPDDTLSILVTFEPQIPGLIEDTLFIRSNDPDETIFRIPLSGTAISQFPNIEVTPDTLQFGEVYLNKLDSLYFYIKNTGLYTLDVEEFNISHPDFFINILGVQVVSGDSVEVVAYYSPSIVGQQNELLTISSSDPDQYEYPVPLYGTGLQAYSGIIDGEIWTAPYSPYVITGNCEVVDLEIQEGVTVLFNGDFEFLVTGILTVIGTVQDSVFFTSGGSKGNWQGLSFINSSSACQLNYSVIENSINSGINIDNTNLVINHCTIRNNTTQGTKNGGGIDAINSSELFIFNSMICNNFSHYEAGGIWSYQNDTISIVNTEFKDNICDENGGAGYIIYTPFYISNCVIDHNKANSKSCGGLVVSNSIGEILNTLFINNYWTGAYGSGGLNLGDSEVDLVNVTFGNNTDYGIVNGVNSTLNISNTILWGNTGDQIWNGGILNIQNSLVQDSISGIINYLGTINWLTGNRSSNPYFKDASSDDYRLTDSSICINAGTPDTTGLNLPFFDLAGNPRIVFDTIDIGAFEFQGSVIAPQIIQEPVSMVVCEGDSAGFNVLASGSPKYYQWQKNGSDLLSATDSILIFNPAIIDNAGNYRCIVWNPLGGDTSTTVSLTVNPLPQFTLGNDTSICAGDTLILDPGSGFANYEWQDMTTSQTFEVFYAGLFWVEVITSEGCVKRDSINITINPVPVADFSYVQGCENNNTQYTDLSTANAPSFSSWFWDFGDQALIDDTSNIQNPFYNYSNTGTYNTTLTVINSFGCSDDIVKPVDIYNSPVVNLGVDQTICSGNNLVLDPFVTGGALPYDYLWSTGAVSETLSINPISDTSISLIVTDNNGCEGYDTVNLLMHQVYQNEEVCIVTVDSASQKNMIVWEKTPGMGTAFYNIYKLPFSTPIGSVLYDSLSVYIDLASSPGVSAESYQITSVDSCGNESQPSDYHRTILLTTSEGVPAGVNLLWNVYEGFEYDWFYIYRGSSPYSLTLIDSVYHANSLPHQYPDLNPPALEFYYRVVVEKHPDSVCDPTLGDYLSGPFKKSLSNIGDGGTPYVFQIKVFLEGPYNNNNYQMTSILYQDDFIPRFQPYNIPPWNYPGEEFVPDIPNPQIVDWLLFELRETSGGPWTALSDSIVYRRATFLRDDGYVVDLDGQSYIQLNAVLSDNIYLVLWHRNHLGIMSGNPIQLSDNLYFHDFTTGLDKVYGGLEGYKQFETGDWGMVSADGNIDGTIDFHDKDSTWIPAVGYRGYYQGDFNFDGEVNNIDKNDYWLPNDGKGTQVPE